MILSNDIITSQSAQSHSLSPVSFKNIESLASLILAINANGDIFDVDDVNDGIFDDVSNNNDDDDMDDDDFINDDVLYDNNDDCFDCNDCFDDDDDAFVDDDEGYLIFTNSIFQRTLYQRYIQYPHYHYLL